MKSDEFVAIVLGGFEPILDKSGDLPDAIIQMMNPSLRLEWVGVRADRERCTPRRLDLHPRAETVLQ